jgi:hypothetical protein
VRQDVAVLRVALPLGLALMVVGGALVPLPGPGYPVLLAGLGVTIIAGIVLVHVRTQRT